MSLEAHRYQRHPNGSASSGAAGLLLIGANHRTCTLDTRERLLRRASYASLRKAGGRLTPWSDLVLLTTCNRVEVYALTETPEHATETIQRALGLSEYEPTLYILRDHDAAVHLLRVASGLDSLAVGEEQVTEQVRKAPSKRPSRNSSHGSLTDLFIQAARVAPRVRRIAGVRPGEASASHAAVRFLEAVFEHEHPIVALIGTGKMARIAAKGLRGRADIRVLNRSLARARVLAKTLDGKAVPLADLREVLAEADVVVAATAVRRPVVTVRTLRAVIRRREGRLLWVIDLGFPRNVDPDCRGLGGVHVLDLDGLAPWGDRHLPPMALARVEARIREEAVRMMESLSPSVSFDVALLRRTAEAFRRNEVEEALARLPGLSEEARVVVDKLSTRLVNRLLHGPTRRIRSLPEGTRTEIVQEIVAGLQGGAG